jgi:hypothetical protein
VEVLMSLSRYAGDEIFARSQQIQQQMMQEAQRREAIMDRQRQRDVAAATGQFIPFTEADVM